MASHKKRKKIQQTMELFKCVSFCSSFYTIKKVSMFGSVKLFLPPSFIIEKDCYNIIFNMLKLFLRVEMSFTNIKSATTGFVLAQETHQVVSSFYNDHDRDFDLIKDLLEW